MEHVGSWLTVQNIFTKEEEQTKWRDKKIRIVIVQDNFVELKDESQQAKKGKFIKHKINAYNCISKIIHIYCEI